MYSKEKIMATLRDIEQESKEISSYVIICQPRRNIDEVAAQSLDGIVLHIDLLGYSRGFINIGGEKVDVARNYLIEKALESDAKYLFFVGEDTVVPYDGFLKLHETSKQNPNSMVVGVYYMKLSSPMISVRVGNQIIPADVTPGRIFEIYSSGLDCALIPMHILRTIKNDDPEIPFCVTAMGLKDEQGEIPFIGEDNFFIHRLKKCGFNVLCNTDVQCLHMDLATGKYTAHPSVDLGNYFTNIKITEPLTMQDKLYIDKRWIDRIPEGTGGKKWQED